MNGFSASGTGQSVTPSRRKKVVPDVRSDIYSLGATLYHLLSGRCPAKNATEVVPLSPKEFSPQIVAIISKAMDKNPDLRYQSAEEMLEALKNLRRNDPRMRRLRVQQRCVCAVCAILLVAGIFASFVGLKRMQTTERWLKLAEYSSNALSDGDTVGALTYAMEAFPEETGLLTPSYTAQAQVALTEALGVYDLADGFKAYRTAELPSAPLEITLAPGGGTVACVCSGCVAVIDTDTAEIIAALPADGSALAEAEYLNDTTLLYAGENGLTAYDIANGLELWTGEAATAISVSADGSTAASIFKDAEYAVVYDAVSGAELCTVDFGGRSQSVPENDTFANSNRNLFALSADGGWLAVSFADGSLTLYHLAGETGVEVLPLLDDTSGYTYFQGGFCQNNLAFSATNNTATALAIFDVEAGVQTLGTASAGYYNVRADETGIYVGFDNLLVSIDPVTYEQTPLTDMKEEILHYASGGGHTLAASASGIQFFDLDLNLISFYEMESGCDFCQIAEGIGIVGSLDTSTVTIFRYENHAEAEICAYDSGYDHDEARLSADGATLVLFSYEGFRVYGVDGSLICETDIPNAAQVYDQRFIREGSESWLEVAYYDGTVLEYSAKDGVLIQTQQEEAPDAAADEEFVTDSLRIVAPLHGPATAYELASGRLVGELPDDGYLIYVNQVGENFVAQYMDTNGECYGYLLNGSCEVLACFPNICDITEDMLIFDYPTGNIRFAQIYELDTLLTLAREELAK